MFKEFNSLPFLSLTDVVLKVFVMMQVGFKSNWTYSHQGFRRMMAFSFAECRRGVGASILQLLWLTLKGYNHCKQTKVEDIREFSPGSSPLQKFWNSSNCEKEQFGSQWTVKGLSFELFKNIHSQRIVIIWPIWQISRKAPFTGFIFVSSDSRPIDLSLGALFEKNKQQLFNSMAAWYNG